jgi:hypothetical protein
MLLIGCAFLASGIAAFSLLRFRQLQGSEPGGPPARERSSAAGIPLGGPAVAEIDPTWAAGGLATAAMTLPCAAHSQRDANWTCGSCKRSYCADCPGESRSPQRCDPCIAGAANAAASAFDPAPETEIYEVAKPVSPDRRVVPENAVLVAVWDKNRQNKLRHIHLGSYDATLQVFGPDGSLIPWSKPQSSAAASDTYTTPATPSSSSTRTGRGFRNAATGEAIGRGYKFRNNVWIYWAQDPAEHQIEVAFK